MEEKNITTQTNEVKQTKPAPQAKTAKKKDNDKDTFADYKAEFKKIVWPTRPEVVKKTFTVVDRTSEEHPLGIFHPHAPLHHIKKENIGLIEVMGLFILPGRLKTELALMNGYLTGEKALVCPAEDDPCCKHFDWLKEIVERRGLCKTAEEADEVLRSEIASVCSQVLCDAGVYKLDANGLAGIKRFMATLGFKG